MSQNPCRSVQVVIFSPLPSSQSSTRPLNWWKRSFISSRAWPMAVRIRSLTKDTRTRRILNYCAIRNEKLCTPLHPGRQSAFCRKGTLTLFWDGIILHFRLPVSTQNRQSVGLLGHFWSKLCTKNIFVWNSECNKWIYTPCKEKKARHLKYDTSAFDSRVPPGVEGVTVGNALGGERWGDFDSLNVGAGGRVKLELVWKSYEALKIKKMFYIGLIWNSFPNGH